MQRNKFLEDLGIDINHYGLNALNCESLKKEKTIKHLESQKEKYGFTELETWNLDTTFIEWMYSRLMMYKKVNDVDLTYHKIEFEKSEYTVEEAIDYIIEVFGDWLLFNYKDRHDLVKELKVEKNVKRAIRMLSEIIFYLWW